jgi:hypothetical protein
MPRIALDLNTEEGRSHVNGQWRFAPGYVPGQPNEGLVSQTPSSPARLADYNDLSWEVCTNVRTSRSKGFTFGWFRMAIELPERIDGLEVAGMRVLFETNTDDYGEVWIDGQVDRATGVITGINVPQRVEVSASATPGERHVIACLTVNGPLAEPRGGVWMRYALLVFESSG